MGKTYKRSADESEYYREQRIRREMDKRNQRKRRSTNDDGELVLEEYPVSDKRKPRR